MFANASIGLLFKRVAAKHRLHLTAFGGGMGRALRHFSCYYDFVVSPVPAAGEPNC